MAKGLLDLDVEALEIICSRLTGSEVVRLGSLCRTLRRVVRGLQFLPPITFPPRVLPPPAQRSGRRPTCVIPGASEAQYSSWLAFLGAGGNAQLSEVSHEVDGTVLARDSASCVKGGGSKTSDYFQVLLAGGLRSLALTLHNDKGDKALSLLLRLAFSPAEDGSPNGLRQLRISCQGDVQLLSPRRPLVCRPDARIEITASGTFLLVGFPAFERCPGGLTISASEVREREKDK